jgi:ATP-dependent DNA ligase
LFACQKLPADTLLDGEVVTLDENGRVSFNLLQNYRSHASAIRFYKTRPQWPGEQLTECVWLRPELVAQIEFAEWTSDGLLRHSKFVGFKT